MNWPADASARRPSSSLAFQTGHAWIMCGQISKRHIDIGGAGGRGQPGGVRQQRLG